MRVFHIEPTGVRESAEWPTDMPPQGMLWLALTREELEATQTAVQERLLAWQQTALLDLHWADLLSTQLPSYFDSTAHYDVLVFRRLAPGSAASAVPATPSPWPHRPMARGGLPVLRRIDTSPVGLALFDRVLLSVHPSGCAVLEAYATRLLAATDGNRAPNRALPENAPDLMLRLLGQMVDAYLDLRRDLTRQLDHWQLELLDPRTRFRNWGRLLDARLVLHQLEEIGEDQRAALQKWTSALDGWGPSEVVGGQPGLEALRVRSRDVLERIERVLHHVRRLEHNAEAAVQMHFSAQSHRANDIMRTLTALTAIFLPLNLVAGIFGMNFDFIPLLQKQAGFWLALGGMACIAATLLLFFWRKRYLDAER